MQQNNIIMTLEEVSRKYGYSPVSIQRNFKRTAEAIKKKYGVELIKCITANQVYYYVDSPRAATIYEEEKEELFIPLDSLQMDDLVFLIFIGIAGTEYYVFKGTRQNFLRYLGLSATRKNVKSLDEALKKYSNKQGLPLVYSEDGSRIIVSFEESFEKRQILTITMLKKSQEIAKKYNKQTLKIAQLLKVWQTYRVYESKGINTLTDKDLRKYINLSQSQLTDVKKMLKKENIIKIDREGNYNTCLGSNFLTNVFFDNKKQVINY